MLLGTDGKYFIASISIAITCISNIYTIMMLIYKILVYESVRNIE